MGVRCWVQSPPRNLLYVCKVDCKLFRWSPWTPPQTGPRTPLQTNFFIPSQILGRRGVHCRLIIFTANCKVHRRALRGLLCPYTVLFPVDPSLCVVHVGPRRKHMLHWWCNITLQLMLHHCGRAVTPLLHPCWLLQYCDTSLTRLWLWRTRLLPPVTVLF